MLGFASPLALFLLAPLDESSAHSSVEVEATGEAPAGMVKAVIFSIISSHFCLSIDTSPRSS